MDLGTWLGISSLIISTAVLAFGLLQYKQVARKDYVDELTRRMLRCETEHAECERERARLTRLTLELLGDTRRLSDKLLALGARAEDLKPEDGS